MENSISIVVSRFLRLLLEESPDPNVPGGCFRNTLLDVRSLALRLGIDPKTLSTHPAWTACIGSGLEAPRPNPTEGWKQFRFHSEYSGSHPELDSGDEEKTYLFRPEIDISRWDGVQFSLFSRSKSAEYLAFEEWIGKLAEGQDYVEITT